MHPIFCAYLIIFLGVLRLNIITSTFGVFILCNLYSNRFHSFIFKLCIMIVYTLKMHVHRPSRFRAEFGLVIFVNWSSLIAKVRVKAATYYKVYL